MGEPNQSQAARIIECAERLRQAVDRLTFADPVAVVYNPLWYAWTPHRLYLERYGGGRKRVLFFGMNPGPWGMVQTGVPFGEVNAVRDWLGITAPVDEPRRVHPKRPVSGYQCSRSEVSGRRLWGLMRERFGTAEQFFRDHFVGNYCPLVFFERDGKNRTPDKLRKPDREALFAVCDEHAAELAAALECEWLVGVGSFAESRANAVRRLLGTGRVQVAKVPHPSPANPAANRGWAQAAAAALEEHGVW